MLLPQRRPARRPADGHRRDHPPVRTPKPHRTSSTGLDLEPALVHQPVVIRAQLNKVLQGGRATPCPVPDVVGVQKLVVGAAWEPAPVVAAPQRPPQSSRNRPRSSSHGQRPAVPLHDPHHRGVARQPSHGLGRQRGPIRQRRPLDHVVGGECRRVDVHDNLTSFSATLRRRSIGGGTRHRHQRICPARRHRRRRVSVLVRRLALERLHSLHHQRTLGRRQSPLEAE
jgi:hypothetical protein